MCHASNILFTLTCLRDTFRCHFFQSQSHVGCLMLKVSIYLILIIVNTHCSHYLKVFNSRKLICSTGKKNKQFQWWCNRSGNCFLLGLQQTLILWAQHRLLMAHLINYWWLMMSCPALSWVTKPSLHLSAEAEIHADIWHLQIDAKLAHTGELIPCRSWWSCPGSWWQPSSVGIGARAPQSQGIWLWKSIKSAKNHMAKSYSK